MAIGYLMETPFSPITYSLSLLQHLSNLIDIIIIEVEIVRLYISLEKQVNPYNFFSSLAHRELQKITDIFQESKSFLIC